jgi:predicted nucleotidyltransferase
MRLTADQIRAIQQAAADVFGADVGVRLLGSRLDDEARGGDVDLLVQINRELGDPAAMAALMEAGVSRAMHGRKVDVLLSAPSLARSPIHEIAERTGVRL